MRLSAAAPGNSQRERVKWLSANYPDLKRFQTKSSNEATNGWYAHAGVGVGMCNIQDVDNCRQICTSVTGCNFFSISTTAPCYACFIYKTCDKPGTGGSSAAPSYRIYELKRDSRPRSRSG